MVIYPSTENSDESAIINPNFDCGNAIIDIKVGLKSYSNDDKTEYIGVIFRYISILGIEEY